MLKIKHLRKLNVPLLILFFVTGTPLVHAQSNLQPSSGMNSVEGYKKCNDNQDDISINSIKTCASIQYSPGLFLDKLSSRMIHEVKRHQSRLDSDACYAHELVANILLPYIDRVAMSALTVMHPWRNASEEDKAQFVEKYTYKVIDDYSSAMTDYTNERVEILPLRKSDYIDKSRVKVQSMIKGGRVDIPVEYRVKRSNGEWRIYDLVVNNISMVRSYRVQFKEVIAKEGLGGLVNKLDKLNHRDCN